MTGTTGGPPRVAPPLPSRPPPSPVPRSTDPASTAEGTSRNRAPTNIDLALPLEETNLGAIVKHTYIYTYIVTVCPFVYINVIHTYIFIYAIHT